jgi:hypothetical protein
MKKNKSFSDMLFGIIAIIALCGVAFILVNYSSDNVVVSNPIINKKPIDSVQSLPIIKFKSDSIKLDSIKKK